MVLPCLFSFGFVGAAFPPTNWTIFDGGSNGITWERDGANGTAPTAGNSTVIDNFSTNTAGDQDALFLEAMDLTSYTSAQLTFDVAYARYDATFFDQLAVVVSTDCGQNYSTIYSKSGTTLATEPDLAAAYTSPSVWRNEIVDLSAFIGNPLVELAFVNVSGYGNYLYLDNINISGVGSCVQPDIATVTASSTTICEGGSATLNIAGNLNDATQWEVYTGSCGGTSIGNTTGTSFVVTPTAPGTTYFIRGEGGCTTPSSCASITINVNANTAGSEAVTACDSYTWLTNGTTYNASGVFTNVLVNSNGCDSIVTLNLTINPSPVVLLNPFGTICDTDSDFSLMGGSPSGGTYSGTGVSGGVFSPTSVGIGTFSIMYTYTETNGCADSIAQDIFVVDCSSLGELENESIILYPNPSFDFVNIISENEKIDRIRVYDGAGRLIQDDLIDSDIQTLDISDYSTGVYQIQIELGGNVYWKRLVKN